METSPSCHSRTGENSVFIRNYEELKRKVLQPSLTLPELEMACFSLNIVYCFSIVECKAIKLGSIVYVIENINIIIAHILSNPVQTCFK